MRIRFFFKKKVQVKICLTQTWFIWPQWRSKLPHSRQSRWEINTHLGWEEKKLPFVSLLNYRLITHRTNASFRLHSHIHTFKAQISMARYERMSLPSKGKFLPCLFVCSLTMLLSVCVCVCVRACVFVYVWLYFYELCFIRTGLCSKVATPCVMTKERDNNTKRVVMVIFMDRNVTHWLDKKVFLLPLPADSVTSLLCNLAKKLLSVWNHCI